MAHLATEARVARAVLGRTAPPSRPIGGLFDALDTNHDGVLDADEISHASESLRKLDRNGDGKLEPDEIRPQGDGRPAPFRRR